LSKLAVANIIFESTESNRIEYTGNNVVRVRANGGFQLPFGTTAQRASPETGLIRYNTDTGTVEMYDAGGWFNTPTGGYVNNIYTVANAAYATANNVAPQIAPAFNTANAAYNAANNVGPQIAPAFNTANLAYTSSNVVYAAVNSAFASINAVYTSSNADYTVSNAAFGVANAAFAAGNAEFTFSNTIYAAVNSAFVVSNAAFAKANSALPLSGGTLTGKPTVSITSNSTAILGTHLTLENPASGTQSALGFSFGGVGKASVRIDSGGSFVLNGVSNTYFFGTDVGAINSYFYNGVTQFMYVTGSNVYVPTDIRTPIVYDSNNTGYYVDPATGSNLNGTFVNNGGTAMTSGWNRSMMLSATFPVLVFNSSSTKYSGIGVDYSTASAGMRFWVNGSSSDLTGTGAIAMNINTDGFVSTGYSFRSPIFYDSDNTGYYVDPASTSVLNSVQIASLGIGTAASGTAGEIRATNAITSYYSDQRLKTKIQTIDNALDKVDHLSGFFYTNNDLAKSFGFTSDDIQVGLSAQDVQKVLPHAVKPAPFDVNTVDGIDISKSGENYLTVQYERIVPLLVEAIKELRQDIKKLKGE